MPATKAIASFKLPNYKSGKVEVQYFHDHATVTSAVGLNLSPTVDVTATMGSPSFAFGAEAGYDTSVGGLYAVDPLTSVKYRLNNHGKLAALMQHAQTQVLLDTLR
ncbi:hypothetical protein MKW92_000082 [Papaver armeniacum]|nr:hypothetical protein MKW92_000082 [Papaver armeniacum]